MIRWGAKRSIRFSICLVVLSILVLNNNLIVRATSGDTYTTDPTTTGVTSITSSTTTSETTLTAPDTGAKSLIWEVFNRHQTKPELTSTEATPRFEFQKDGLKKVILTTTSESGDKTSKEYNLVTTLSRPVIYSAIQILNRVYIKGSAIPKSVVLVYMFSKPTLVQTQADDSGYFTASIATDQIPAGQHRAVAVSTSKSAAAETGFINKVGDVVGAQINEQLKPGDVIAQQGDLPLIVAQPIASDPANVTIQTKPLSGSLMIFIGLLILLLILIWFTYKHLHTSLTRHHRTPAHA